MISLIAIAIKKMKKRLLYILLTVCTYTYAQQEAANWYFGENAGINFGTDGSITVLNDGQLNTVEGCSSISDASGNLLFYTDGQRVYNRNHLEMSTFLLKGDESSTQSAIVVPKPNDPNIYYIFTVGSNQTTNGLNYYTVDMTLNGGLGGMVGAETELLERCSEKISAVLKDCQSGSIWVIALSNLNGNGVSTMNTFHAFEISTTGVDTTPVSTRIGTLNITDLRGYLKLSPNGEKLACASTSNGLHIFDFDTDTGHVSNPLRLNISGTNNKPYGIEFSPNSNLLYVTSSNDFFGTGDHDPRNHHSVLTQFNLGTTDIQASELPIDRQDMYRSALQLGPDGKIYRSMSLTYSRGAPYLSVINNPNTLGVGCDYQSNAIDLGTNNSTQGLPPFIASFFAEDIDIIRNGSETTFLPLCTGDTYTLEADNIPDATYEWTFNGNIISENDYDLVVSQNGIYEVTINLNDGGCGILEGKAIVEYFDYPVANLIDDISICDDNNDDTWSFDFTSLDIDALGTQDASIYSVHYFESEADANNNDNEIIGAYENTSNPQTIWYRVDNDGNPNCYDLKSFIIRVLNTPTANDLEDQAVCDDDTDGDNTNGQVEINLTNFNDDILNGQNAADYNITYHSSLNDAINGFSDLPLTYYNQTPFSETIFTRIENKENEDCFDTNSFNIIVNPLPVVVNTSLIQCDEDGINDEITTFNLNQIIDDITGGNTNLLTTFHESLTDAQDISATAVNADAFTNNANPQIIYARVKDDNTGCFNIANVTLQVSTTQVNDYIANPVCDELNSEDGINSFNLDDFTTDIQTQNNITFPVTYYSSYNDALLEQNELTSPYTNTQPYNETIYFRVENANACFGIGEALLTINELPQLEDDETVLYCLNNFPSSRPIDAGIVNDNPNNYSYNWSSGENTYEIMVNTVGTYTVTATNINTGCSKSRNITVNPSNIATFDSIEVIDASENNTITVLVSGEGDYEYALFDQNGIITNYQTSNTFTNVYPGIYTVSVKDVKNDCGIVENSVSVIGFPKFFTPNGDGTNDTWQVQGISSMFQPNSKILIFDRYGKLLKQLDPLGPGWDGTYNGNVLPVSDYWFSVTLQDGRTYNNHFTLKR